MTVFEICTLVLGALTMAGSLAAFIFFGGRYTGRIEASNAAATAATVGLQATVAQQAVEFAGLKASVQFLKDAHSHHVNSYHRDLAGKIDDVQETAIEARTFARVGSGEWGERGERKEPKR